MPVCLDSLEPQANLTVTFGDVGEIIELSLATMTLRAPLLVGLAALASIINAEAPAQLISGRSEFAAPTAAAVAGSPAPAPHDRSAARRCRARQCGGG